MTTESKKKGGHHIVLFFCIWCKRGEDDAGIYPCDGFKQGLPQARGGKAHQLPGWQRQIFAFLGPNGAGKSTTINILSTLLLKSSGSVCIGGMDLDRQRKQVKREIGIVFQDDVLDGSLSVYQNLLYRGGLYIPKEKELKKRISELSSLLMLEQILPRKYRECSGGQKRLAQIARALLPAPGLLILDEPTPALTPLRAKRFGQCCTACVVNCR